MIRGYISIIVAGLFLAATTFDRMYEKAPHLAMFFVILFLVSFGNGIALLTASYIRKDAEDDKS